MKCVITALCVRWAPYILCFQRCSVLGDGRFVQLHEAGIQDANEIRQSLVYKEIGCMHRNVRSIIPDRIQFCAHHHRSDSWLLCRLSLRFLTILHLFYFVNCITASSDLYVSMFVCVVAQWIRLTNHVSKKIEKYDVSRPCPISLVLVMFAGNYAQLKTISKFGWQFSNNRWAAT